MFSCEIYKIFKNTDFYRTSLLAAFVILQGNPCVAVHFINISNPIVLYFRPFRGDRCKDMPFLPHPELMNNSEYCKSFDDLYGKKTKDVIS